MTTNWDENRCRHWLMSNYGAAPDGVVEALYEFVRAERHPAEFRASELEAECEKLADRLDEYEKALLRIAKSPDEYVARNIASTTLRAFKVIA